MEDINMTPKVSEILSRNSLAVGYAAAGITVLIWASWLIATRYSASTHLGTLELGLFRFGIPALALSPVWLKKGVLPKGVPLHLIAVMVLGAGALFFEVTAGAIHHVEAGFAGVMLGGGMPFATAMLGVLVFGQRLDSMRTLGMTAIVSGTITLLLPFVIGGSASWSGAVLLLCGAFLWASYTHAFKASALTPLHASAIIAFWSFVILLMVALVRGVDFSEVSWADSGLQLVSQGLLSGLVATFAFGVAIKSLGGVQAAAFTALTPVLAVLGGAVLLGEQPGPNVYLAALLTCVGVLLSTGFLSRRAKAA
jgi:drug/metabolite transporter (DMT)-like permease